MTLPIGKLPADLLRDLLQRYAMPDSRVRVGPGVGRDAAVIEMGDRLLIAKTDPITFATDQIGWYAVHVNANDVACCGGTPRWFLATLLLPEQGTDAELAESIFAQIAEACRSLGVVLCGGHTEITAGLDRPIVVGHMLGEADSEHCLLQPQGRPGDHLLMTKAIALEGTAILARELARELAGVVSEPERIRCANLLRDPGISVVREALAAVRVGGVRVLHDPTEGGLATGLWELAEAAGVGLVIDADQIDVLPECQRICAHLGLDPLGLIASGTLLLLVAPDRSQAILEALAALGIPARRIGEAIAAGEGCWLRQADGRRRPLPVFTRDELARLLG